MLEVRKLSAKMINLAGIISLIVSGLTVFTWILVFLLMEVFGLHGEVLRDLRDLVRDESTNLIKAIGIGVIGIFFMIGAGKLKAETRPLFWSVVCLVLGLILLFELHSGGMLGSASAAVVAVVGGGLSLWAVLKESNENNGD